MLSLVNPSAPFRVGHGVVAVLGCFLALAGLAGLHWTFKPRPRPSAASGRRNGELKGMVVPGLINPSNLCFLNSILQALAASPRFGSYLRESSDAVREQEATTDVRAPAMLAALSEVIASLAPALGDQSQGSRHRLPALDTNKAVLRCLGGSSLRNGRQQDACEALEAVLDLLTDEVREWLATIQRPLALRADALEDIMASTGVAQASPGQGFLSSVDPNQQQAAGEQPRAQGPSGVHSVAAGGNGIAPAVPISSPEDCMGSQSPERCLGSGEADEAEGSHLLHVWRQLSTSPVQVHPFTVLHLAVPASGDKVMAGRSVGSCLQDLVAPEMIFNVACEGCSHKATEAEIRAGLSQSGSDSSEHGSVEPSTAEHGLLQDIGKCQGHLDDCPCHRLTANAGREWLLVRSSIAKSVKIARLPKVLCIQLRRAHMTHSGANVKLAGHLQFPLLLDMAPFVNQELSNMPSQPPRGVLWGGTATRQPGSGQSAGLWATSDALLRLVAVVVHHGDAHSGHYTTFRYNELPGVAPAWKQISDARIIDATVEEVLSCEATLLVYELVP